MTPELTRGLWESVEFAAQSMRDHAMILRESHLSQDGWDSEAIRKEHQACLKHGYRLECFALSLAVVLRRAEREREAIIRCYAVLEE